MIAHDFDYYEPVKIEESVQLYRNLKEAGKAPYYFSGGTEIITLGRLNLVKPDAIIDIKKIPECNQFGFDQDHLFIGAALRLNEFERNRSFPLLSSVAKEIADHTSNNTITVGGNICGQIYYREAVLPFLLADSICITAGNSGLKMRNINDMFDQHLLLEDGELLVSLATKKEYVKAKSISIKIRQQWNTGYPLVTVAALNIEGFIRVAFSGVCPFPFRSESMEQILNDRNVSLKERIAAALQKIPDPVLDDIEGSKTYRLFVLKDILTKIVKKLGDD
ncbi:FAD binding domain-containing protein [Pradoshia sp.]